ncbi:uncharacterized protein LOC109795300 isoform X2 [Cajanus cajan]|nr:uncharacterized protein LOC109795300 isoform X2 [Cajanus cajan]
MSHMQPLLQKPGIIPIHSVGWNSQSRLFTQSLAVNSHNKWKRTLVFCAKTTEAIDATKSEASLDRFPEKSLEGKPWQMFPSGFETLILEVCDETQIAELRLKVGETEMHLKRTVGVTKAPMANSSPTTTPPVPTKPVVESVPSIPPPSPAKSSPFVNDSLAKSSKLAALDASGSNNYVVVSSPTVGAFRRYRIVKGKRQPPVCKEGDLIKEGQVIGYLEQFGTSLPVKTDVGGEVLKLLFQDGEAVGYRDPLIAILPSFQNSK